jgi:hypothetical protein
MKLINTESNLKTVEYFGLLLDVPHDTWYLATSPRGEVSAWSEGKPQAIKSHNSGYWWSCSDHDCLGVVAVVDLEGMDWTQTAREVMEA